MGESWAFPRVIYNQTVQPPVIVTAFFDRRL